MLNLQLARVYASASDPHAAERTWQDVMDEAGKTKTGETAERWKSGMKDSAFDYIRTTPLLETRPDHFLHVLHAGTVSTNVFLRRLHNFALDMDWLLKPVLAKRQWPNSLLPAQFRVEPITSSTSAINARISSSSVCPGSLGKAF